MPSEISHNGKIEEVDLLNLFPPQEGSIDQYYGRIGQGKTYASTADALQDLRSGRIVYANWPIQWYGYDQRSSWFYLLLGILGLKRNFYVFPKENFHYFPIKATFVEDISRLTDCIVYLDEGHLAFDSYEMSRMSVEKRAAALHTRHFNRTIRIISQRPTAIHVSLRANVNRFFKCERIFKLGKIVLFRKSEYQDLTAQETVNDEIEPISTQLYFGKPSVFNAYDSKYLRGKTPRSQENYVRRYKPTYLEKVKYFFRPSCRPLNEQTDD